MLSDLIWDIATSNLVLAIIALALLAAFAIAHLPFGKWIPAIAPYVVAATLAAHVLFGLLAFLVGFRISDDREEAKRLRDKLAWSDNQLKQQTASAEEAARLKEEAEQRANEAKGKLDEYRSKFEGPSAVCAWTDDELNRLRSLRRAR